MTRSWQTSKVSAHEVGTCPPGMPWKAYLGETCPHGLEIALEAMG